MTAILLLFDLIVRKRTNEDEWRFRRSDAREHFKNKLPELVRENPGKFALISHDGQCMINEANYRYSFGRAMWHGDSVWGYHVFRIPKEMPRKSKWTWFRKRRAA
jgi:hypothetical protein